MGYINRSNENVISVPAREERSRKNNFENIISDKSWLFMKNMNVHTHEVQKTSVMINTNTKKPHLRVL